MGLSIDHCGKTARAMTVQRCKDAYASNSGNASDLNCKRAVKRCQELGATPDQERAAKEAETQQQLDAAAAAAVTGAITPASDAGAPTGGGKLGATEAGSSATGGSNTLLIVGVVSAVAIIGTIAIIIIRHKAAGAAPSK